MDVQIEAGELTDICRTIFTAFAERKRALLELTSKRANLEDVFIELTESAFTKKELSGNERKESKNPKDRMEEDVKEDEIQRKEAADR